MKHYSLLETGEAPKLEKHRKQLNIQLYKQASLKRLHTVRFQSFNTVKN